MNPNALTYLRRFARPRSADRERCELCSLALADEHEHLIELAARRLVCACGPCAVLFGHRGDAKYRRVPRRIEWLNDLRMTDLQWEALGLPVNLAFFRYSTPADRVVAVYPSPGGATEAVVDSEAWRELIEENPSLNNLEPDVEALLVNRVGEAREHYRVGIDECYKLVGLIRQHWQGFSGGPAWDEIGRFFAKLRERSVGGTHA